MIRVLVYHSIISRLEICYKEIPEFLDSRRWALNAGLWTLDSGRWTLDVGRWTLDATLRTLGSRHWTLFLTVLEQNQKPVSNSA